jgi:DNA repair ATPase RecN
VDFVKEDNLRKAVENCSNSHRQFEKKVSEFKKKFSDAKRKVEELFSCGAASSIRNLDLTIKEHQRFINEQKSIMQSLRLVDFVFNHLNRLPIYNYSV